MSAVRRALLVAGLALLTPGAAQAEARYDPATADATVLAARKDAHDGFCKTPPNLLLSPQALRLCPLAKQVPDCAELAAACDRALAKPEETTRHFNLGWLGDFLAVFGRTAMWFIVAAVPLFLLWLVLDASIKARRDKEVADKPKKPALVTSDPVVHALESITDAERLLAMAGDHARRGQFEHAQALYLAASLAALDRRGAIRLAKHRTNGEYVRACKEAAAKPELRAIVREVDRVHFGKEAPTGEGVAQVAARAAAIVRAVAVTAVMALFLLGCQQSAPTQPDADPGGDGLFLQLLERQGVKVGRPDHSLATLPMPTDDDAPLLVVDAERTLLEPDAKAHLVRWVRAGGRLFLFGGVESWPDDVGAHGKGAGSHEVKLRFLAGDMDPDDVVDDDGYAIYPGHVAELAGIQWKEVGDAFGETGDHVDYAGVVDMDKGLVVGVASDDLITNVGLATPPNARAVVALLARYAGPRRILVARPEDGVSPPSGPIASLVHAGLGLALGHAAVATVLLLLAFGVRQSRARPTPEPARRAWTEHVAATGTLYARWKLAPHALATYARFVDGRLRTRMPRGMTDPAAFLAIRSGQDAGHCAEVWARAMASRAGDRVQGDELATLADLRELYAATVKTE